MSTGVLDPADFRQVLGHHPPGVALISSVTAEGTPVGMIVGTFTSVSLDPPLVGFLPTRDSASFAEIVWRHPLAAVAGRALAPAGATFAAICLATGSIWGRPTWGTWWEWDGRLTSMLILFFLYLGYIALASAERERGGDGRMSALFSLVGAINLPIIHYSVLWWRTLHQGQSISITGGSSIAPELLWPLPLTLFGFSFLLGAAVLMRMRAELALAKAEARLRRAAAEDPNPLSARP